MQCRLAQTYDGRASIGFTSVEYGIKIWYVLCYVCRVIRRSDRYQFKCLSARRVRMNNLFRTGLAGVAAYKWGGGIISTIVIFLLVFWLLGKC